MQGIEARRRLAREERGAGVREPERRGAGASLSGVGREVAGAGEQAADEVGPLRGGVAAEAHGSVERHALSSTAGREGGHGIADTLRGRFEYIAIDLDRAERATPATAHDDGAPLLGNLPHPS